MRLQNSIINMKREDVLTRLQDIIREAVDNEEVIVNNDTVATDVDGWDSLTQVLIVGELQNAFGVKFTSIEISSFANVGALVDAILLKL